MFNFKPISFKSNDFQPNALQKPSQTLKAPEPSSKFNFNTKPCGQNENKKDSEEFQKESPTQVGKCNSTKLFQKYILKMKDSKSERDSGMISIELAEGSKYH